MAALIDAFIELIEALSIIYIVIGLGIIWRFSRFYKPEYGKWFTQIVFWIFFPISIISSFAKIESFAGEVILLVTIITIVVHLFSFLATYISTKNRPSEETGSLVLCSTFPNALLFPFPIILAIAGSIALFYATIFVFVAMVLRNSFGLALGIAFQPLNSDNSDKVEIEEKLNYRKAFIDLLKFPPFLALALGFLLHAAVGPQTIANIPGLDIAKDISLYGALLLVGISFQDLQQLHPRNFFSKDVSQVAFARFIVGPLAALILVILLPVTSIMAIPLLIQSMAPPAISNIIYGKFFNFDTSQISLLITTLTVFALVLLPLELMLIMAIFPINA
jgi:predicted permease